MITEPSSGASGSTTPGTGLYLAVGHFTFAIGKIGQKLVFSQKCDGSRIMLDTPARTGRLGHYCRNLIVPTRGTGLHYGLTKRR